MLPLWIGPGPVVTFPHRQQTENTLDDIPCMIWDFEESCLSEQLCSVIWHLTH